MKGTETSLFLAHQRRCVKCRDLRQARKTSGYDLMQSHDYLVMLRLHERVVKMLYHQDGAEEPSQGR